MKIRTTVVALAAVTLLAGMTACSSSSGSTGSGGSSDKGDAPAAAKTYSASDLESIVKKVNSQLSLSGQVLTNDKIQSTLKKSGGVSSLLSGKDVTVTPKACATKFSDTLATKPPADSIGAGLVYGGTNTVTVTSESKKALPANFFADSSAKTDDLLSSCSTMQISVSSVKIGLNLKKVDVQTDADKTYAIQETLKLPAGVPASSVPGAVTAVTALKGNLVVSATGSAPAAGASATPGAKDPAEVVNAIIAAAK